MIINRDEKTNTRALGIDYTFNGVEAVIASLGVPRRSRTALQLATPLVPAVLAVAREAAMDTPAPTVVGQQQEPKPWERNWWNIALPLAVGVLGVGVLAFTKFAAVQKRG